MPTEAERHAARASKSDGSNGSPVVKLAMAVEVRDLCLQYQAQNKPPFVALDGFSLTAHQGEFIAVVGPSGCGKSTLLAIIAGLATATSGDVLVSGQRVLGVRRDLGFIFQKDALLPWRTALENVALPLKFRGVDRSARRELALGALKRMGLSRFGDRYPHQLSGGQRKRVAIAATLVYEPDVLLMDEPFGALDVQTRDLIENDILRDWEQRGRQTVVFVTHDLEEAIALSDRVIVMTASPGRVLAEYTVTLSRPRDMLQIKVDNRFRELHEKVWQDLKVEVLKAQALDRDPVSP